MRKHRVAWTSVLATSLVTVGLVALPTSPAQSAVGDSGSSSGAPIFATGGGATAALREQIAWLSWAGHGVTIPSGHEVTNWVQVSDVARLEVACSLTHVSGDTITGYRPGTWNGDGFDNRFNIGGTGTGNQLVVGVIHANDGGDATFDVQCSGALVTYDGSGWAVGNRVDSSVVELPGLVVADAESQARGVESVSARPLPLVTSSDVQWRIIDKNQGCSSGPNMVAARATNGTLTMTTSGGGGEECSGDPGTAMVTAFAGGASGLRITVSGRGLQAAAIGYILPVDYGDAPVSYGVAGAQSLTWTAGSPFTAAAATQVSVSGYTASTFPAHGATVTAATPRLGPSLTTERVPDFSPSASGDTDNAFSTAPGTLTEVSPGATFSWPSNATRPRCRAPGSVTGWLDWNRNGVFDAGEQSNVVTCTSTGTNGGAVNLTWTVPADAQGGTTFVRFVVAGSAAELAPTGIVSVGEVEDFQVTSMIRDVRTTKTADQSQMPGAGGVVSYSVTITNVGNAAYTSGVPAYLYDDVTGVVDDAVRSSVSRTPGSAPAPTISGNRISWQGPLAVGASVTLTYTMTVRPDGEVGDQIMSNVARASNTAIGTGTPVTCAPGSPDELAGICARVDLYRARLDVTKHAYLASDTGFTTPLADGVELDPGTHVVWRYTVRNTGSIVLTDIQLTDVATDTRNDGSGTSSATSSPSITCAGSPAVTPGTAVTIPTLAGGAQRVCQASGVIGGT